jgi:hypothetical protein
MPASDSPRLESPGFKANQALMSQEEVSGNNAIAPLHTLTLPCASGMLSVERWF